MAITLVSNVGAASTNNNDVTTAGIDTSTATFIVCGVGTYAAIGGPSTMSDSNGNTWRALPLCFARNSGQDAFVQIFYVANPIVGAAHTFTNTATGGYPAIGVIAFAGVATTGPLDQLSQFAGGASLTVQSGSITPTEDGQVVISAACQTSAGTTFSINGGFTISDQAGGTANAQKFGLAYLIQGAAAAANPTWTSTGSANFAAQMGTFSVPQTSDNIFLAVQSPTIVWPGRRASY